jgi:phosphoserine phosphatase RsbU/P
LSSSFRPETPPTAPPSLDLSLADHLRDACASAASASEPAATALRLLTLCMSATGATRGSMLTLNPTSGNLRILAGVGLASELIGRDVPPRPRSISEWVFRHRRGVVLNGAVSDQRFESAESDNRIESALSIPILSGEGIAGVLNLARHTPAPNFGDAEMAELIRALSVIGGDVERGQRAVLEQHAWRDVERLAALPASTLLPYGSSQTVGFEVSLLHQPSSSGGTDRCERVPHPGGAQTFLVLDVAGHGAVAAATAGFVQGLFVSVASPERSAAGMVARLNAEMYSRLGERRFAALWLAQVSGRGEVAYCNAGFSAPLWVPADGNTPARLDRGGPPAGAFAHARYEEEQFRMLPGDLLVLASDGLLQARGNNDQPFGHERLAEIVDAMRRQPLERLTAGVADAVREFSGRAAPTDDLTLFALRYSPNL